MLIIVLFMHPSAPFLRTSMRSPMNDGWEFCLPKLYMEEKANYSTDHWVHLMRK